MNNQANGEGSTNLAILGLLPSEAKKAKKGGEKTGKICAVPTQKNGGKMKRKNTKRKDQQGCDVEKVIDTIEKTASTAKKIYRAVEPVVKTILEYRRKTK